MLRPNVFISLIDEIVFCFLSCHDDSQDKATDHRKKVFPHVGILFLVDQACIRIPVGQLVESRKSYRAMNYPGSSKIKLRRMSAFSAYFLHAYSYLLWAFTVMMCWESCSQTFRVNYHLLFDASATAHIWPIVQAPHGKHPKRER